MISTQEIERIALLGITGTPLFLVNVSIQATNKIEVLVDDPSHLSIPQCVTLSKFIESNLDREKEDFELTVSSPGLDQPLKVDAQYHKTLGKEVSVLKKDGVKIIGKLLAKTEKHLELQTLRTENGTRGKGAKKIIEQLFLDINEIKETKLVLPF